MIIKFENIYRASKCSSADHAVLENLGWTWFGRAMEWRTKDIRRVVPVLEFTVGEARSRVQEAGDLIHGRVAASASITAPDGFTCPAPDGLEYRPYQLAGIKYMYETPDVLLGDDMRLGKTVQTIGLINKVQARKILIVPPATLKINWARELCKWLVEGLTISICQGKKIGDPDADVIICNYDIVHNFIDVFHERAPWDVLVCDESHRLRTDSSRRTKLILGTKGHRAISAKRRVFLSGTQLYTRPRDLWTICNSCDPQGLGANWWKFVHRYCDAKKNFFGHLETDGASNCEELQEFMRQRFMIRRTMDQVSDTIKAIPQTIPLSRAGAEKLLKQEKELVARHTKKITGKLGVNRDELQDFLAGYLDDSDVKEQADFAEEEEQHYATVRRELGIKKIPQVVDFVKELLDAQEKIVVFGHHRDVVTGLHEKFPGSAILIGGMTGDKKQAEVDRFTNDPNCRVIVGNMLSAGEGISLAVSSVAVFAELSGIAAEVDQAERRIELVDKKIPGLIYYLAMEGSLDERLAHILTKRRDVFQRTMNVKRITNGTT